MKTVRVYGAYDDLVEIDGEIEGCDEYKCDTGYGFITFSDGTILSIDYSKAEEKWIVGHLIGGESIVEKDDDSVVVSGNSIWVTFATF